MQKTALCNRRAKVIQLATSTFNPEPRKQPKRSRLMTKTLLIMKLTVLFLALGLFSANATGLSQTVTFSGKNVKLTKVFNAIESQTGYSFFANKDLLKNVKPVSVSVKDMPLMNFLDIVLTDQPIDYEINNKTIFIKEKRFHIAADNPGQPPVPSLLELTGTVLSSDGTPLQGATITIKGTKTTTTTDGNWRFLVNADANAVLIISFIGYKTEEVKIEGRSSINVVLQKVVGEIEQVVVTALGIAKKTKALTYNVQEIKGDELNKVKDANFVNSLNGKVA